MNDVLKALTKAIEDIEEHIYQSTQIILINSEEFLKMVNLDDYPDNVYFICNPHVDKGTAYILKDSDFKRTMYEFCNENPDIVLRGRKAGL